MMEEITMSNENFYFYNLFFVAVAVFFDGTATFSSTYKTVLSLYSSLIIYLVNRIKQL
jgi:hypothetical protein